MESSDDDESEEEDKNEEENENQENPVKPTQANPSSVMADLTNLDTEESEDAGGKEPPAKKKRKLYSSENLLKNVSWMMQLIDDRYICKFRFHV